VIKMKSQKGIALILAIGILAVLSVVATSFALNMRLEYKIARNYNNRVKARYLAYAALQKAIVELKDNAKKDAFNSPAASASSIPAGSEGLFHSANAAIEDEQGKLNVNNCSPNTLKDLFSYIIEEKGVSNLSPEDADHIMTVRPASGYSHLEDIVLQSTASKSSTNVIDAEIA